jgi:hypothetical protein
MISGGAIFKSIVDYLESPIVIIEEAGLVLESHMLPILNKNTKHLIMIGDH